MSRIIRKNITLYITLFGLMYYLYGDNDVEGNMLVSIPISKINASIRDLVDIEKPKEIHAPTSLKDQYYTSKEPARYT